MIAPDCHNKSMELKTAYSNGTIQFNRPCEIKNKMLLFFQCKKCGKVKWEDILE